MSTPESLTSRMQTWTIGPVSTAESRPIHSDRYIRSKPVDWYCRYHTFLMIGDAAVILMVVALSYVVRFDPEAVPPPASLRESLSVVIIWMLLLGTVDSRNQRVLAAGLEEYRRVVAGCFYAFGAVAILSYLLRAEISRFYFLMALPLGTILLLGFRWLARGLLARSRQRGENMVPTVIVGAPRQVARVTRELKRRAEFGLEPSAHCLIGVSANPEPGEVPLPQVSMARIPELVANKVYGSVVVAGGLPPNQLKHLTWALERSRIDVILFSDIVDATGPRFTLQEVSGLNLIHVDLPCFTGWRLWAKRAFDILLSAVALVLLAPVLLVIAIAIYVDDPGPVIFRQQRIGLRGQPFTIHKFRSMAVDAESRLAALRAQSIGNGPLFKMENDPRLTRVGRFLRKYSLDELPQFWTALKGDMSVVGPRPHLEKELDQFPDEGLRRLLIKPGITGLWQVSGRSDLSLEDSIKLDLRYVENWSIVGDLVIVLQTVKAMVTPKGAY